jgi:HELP motif
MCSTDTIALTTATTLSYTLHRAIAAPTGASPADLRDPDAQLELEWVHGFSCKSGSRGLVQYVTTAAAASTGASAAAATTIVFAAGTLAGKT